jgi:hypothetical protein
VLMSAGHALLAYKLISPKLLVVELLTEQWEKHLHFQ